MFYLSITTSRSFCFDLYCLDLYGIVLRKFSDFGGYHNHLNNTQGNGGRKNKQSNSTRKAKVNEKVIKR